MTSWFVKIRFKPMINRATLINILALEYDFPRWRINALFSDEDLAVAFGLKVLRRGFFVA
jgi:hypothetical protein